MLKNVITLTPHQKEVFEKLDDWFNTQGDPVQSLIGYAGVGKTTMVSQLILRLIKNDKKVVVLTFTNKALAVCREVYGKYCGKDKRLTYSTIHAFFKLKPDYEITDEEISLLFGDDSEECLSADLVIVDEASQLPNALVRLITQNRLDKTKILFMGDSHQLPPIEKQGSVKKEGEMDDLSSVRTSEAFVHNPLYLKEIIRQKNDNPILNWYEAVHSDLNGKTECESLHMVRAVLCKRWTLGTESQGILVVDKFEDFKQMYMAEAMNDVVMATFRRETSFRWNKLVHESLFGLDKHFCPGEPLLVYKRWQGKGLTLNNGEVTTILSSCEEKYKAGYYTFDVIKINTSYGNDFFVLKDTPYNYSLLEEYVAQQMTSFDHLTAKERRMNLGKMYTLFDKLGLTRDVTVNLGYRKLTINKSLDYGYACTTHKLQGTTVRNVYICIQDFITCTNLEMLIRLLYVAMSRAKERIILYNKER